MSNFEFLIILYIFNFSSFLIIFFRSLLKKSPRLLIKYLFLPILLTLPLSLFLQSNLSISEVSSRQLIANILILFWCLKSFSTYNSLKKILLNDLLDGLRESILRKEFLKIILSLLKVSSIQFICFSSIFSINYLSGYSELKILDILGIFVCVFGITIELLSERELKISSNNKSKIITTGPWSFVRHPNLVGIFFVFLGVQMLALNAVGSNWSLLGLFFVSFIIFRELLPTTENRLNLKYSEYSKYMETVPKFFTLNLK